MRAERFCTSASTTARFPSRFSKMSTSTEPRQPLTGWIFEPRLSWCIRSAAQFTMLDENKIHVSRPCMGDSFPKISSPPPGLMPRRHSARNSQLANCDVSPRRTPSRTLISALAMRSLVLQSWSSLILTILHGSTSARLKLPGSQARWRSTQLVRGRNAGWGDPERRHLQGLESPIQASVGGAQVHRCNWTVATSAAVDAWNPTEPVLDDGVQSPPTPGPRRRRHQTAGNVGTPFAGGAARGRTRQSTVRHLFNWSWEYTCSVFGPDLSC